MLDFRVVESALSVGVRDHGRAFSRGFDDLLRELGRFDATPFRALSLYLDVRWSDEKQRERARLFVKDEVRAVRSRLGDGEADAWVERDLDRLEALVEERVRQTIDPADASCAIFLCGARQLELAVRLSALLPASLPDRLSVGPILLLRPLFGVPCHRRALAVVVDRSSARFYVVTPSQVGAAAVREAAVIESDVPKRHKQGGWSQLHLQHRFAERLDAFLRGVAERAIELSAASGVEQLVIAAREDAASGIERHLGRRDRARVLRVMHVDPSATADDVLLLAVARRLDEAAGDESTEKLAVITDGSAALGRGVVGAVEVVRAANEGRLRELLIAEQFCRDGWRCSECGALGEGNLDRCPGCSHEVQRIELGEALARRAVECGARVELLPGASRLDSLGGVAAELRY